MKHIYILLFLIILGTTLEVKAQEIDLNQLPLDYRTIGPYRGGRVTTVAGTVQQPGTFYMGATGGGVWKTADYGTTWNNVSDGFFTCPSIGAIAVAQNDANIVYAGTGSDGIRSNVIVGDGVYKSIDAGKTWKHVGLKNVGQIGALEIDPTNHNIVFVAAQGNPFGYGPDRGVYRTIDGGRSWEKVLFVSDETGFSDIELLPSNPNIVFATAWKNQRKPWTIMSGGKMEEGGLYKSYDGGESWTKIIKGLPSDLIGKIDLAIPLSDSKIVYALVEAPGKKGGLYKSIDQGENFELVSNTRGIRTRPFYYTNVDVNPQNPDEVYVLATGYYKSIDGGKKWSRISSPHGDNHDMWINPENPQLFIQANDGGANVTHNGGKTWSTQFNQPTVEVYQVEVDDQYPYWVYGGQQDNYTTVALPSRAPYGMQDPVNGFLINTGGCETGPAVPKPGDHNIVYANCKGRFSVYDKRTGLERSYDVGARNMYGHNPAELKYRFQRVSPIHVSPHDPSIIYHTSQYVHKTSDEGKTWTTISPDLTAFEKDKQVISGSPITRDITGEEFYSTIYSIRESPLAPGVIWTGANDGPVHVTLDGGSSWNKVTPKGLPGGGRVDAVEPSPHKSEKAYVAVLRYMLEDTKPYIYRTNNNGKNWELLTGPESGFPQDCPTRVIREDSEREGLLFAGTECGIFVSFNDGVTWQSFQKSLPITPITDLKIHEDDVVMSTMGRGFWIMDDISLLRDSQLGQNNEAYLFQPAETIKHSYPKMRSGMGPRPGAHIDYYLSDTATSGVTLLFVNSDGDTIQSYQSSGALYDGPTGEAREMSTNRLTFIRNESLKTTPGFHRFVWDFTRKGPWVERESRRYRNGPTVSPDTYTVVLKVDEKVFQKELVLLPHPGVLNSGVQLEDMQEQEAINIEVVSLMSNANRLLAAIKKAKNKRKNQSEESTKSIEEIQVLDKAIGLLETAEGTYMKPMLVSQIRYLYNITSGADQVVGQEAKDRLEELKQELEEIKILTAEVLD